MSYSEQPNNNLWGDPSTTQSGIPYNDPYTTNNDPTGTNVTNTPGAATGRGANSGFTPATPAAATTSTSAGDFSLDSLKLSADGHLWGEKRVISSDPNNPGSTRYQFVQVDLGDSTTPAGLAAISGTTGIPTGAITASLPGLQATLAQNQRAGNGSIIGQNQDGSYSYYDRSGNIKTSSNPGDLSAVGIQPAQITQAQTDRINGQRTVTQAGQYTIVGVNPNGTVAVKDYYGNTTNVSAQQASGMPGITAGQIQDAQLQANSNNWQSAKFSFPGLNLPGQSPSPTPTPGQPTITPTTTTTPSPTPDSRGGPVLPGQTPSPMPTAGGGAMTAASSLTNPTPAATGTSSLTNYAPLGASQPSPDSRGGPVLPGQPGATPTGTGTSPATQSTSTTPVPMPTGTGTTSTGAQTQSGTPAPNTTDMTNQQAQQYANQGQTAKTLAAFGQYNNISAGPAGQGYTATNYLGQHQTLTGAQLQASGSATAADLLNQQQAYSQQQRQFGAQMRAGKSQVATGYDPNQISSRLAGS